MARLENWYVTDGSERYDTPALPAACLSGLVYGHPNRSDGRRVYTSPVTNAGRGRAITRSGTVYELGTPDPQWIRWLAEKGVAYDFAALTWPARAEVRR